MGLFIFECHFWGHFCPKKSTVTLWVKIWTLFFLDVFSLKLEKMLRKWVFFFWPKNWPDVQVFEQNCLKNVQNCLKMFKNWPGFQLFKTKLPKNWPDFQLLMTKLPEKCLKIDQVFNYLRQNCLKMFKNWPDFHLFKTKLPTNWPDVQVFQQNCLKMFEIWPDVQLIKTKLPKKLTRFSTSYDKIA